MLVCCAIDNTTRPQNLHRNVNLELYDMIMKFHEKTGIPAVVNTSLNGGGEPIVESPYDLLMFVKKRSMIDYVIINGKYLINNTYLNNPFRNTIFTNPCFSQ